METTKLSFPGASRRVVGGTMVPAAVTNRGETVWFSLSTVAHEQPPRAEGSCAGALVLHEDTWRQCEFFPESNADHVHQMVALLRDQKPRVKGTAGFREIYARAELPISIASLGLRLSALFDSLKFASSSCRGLALRSGSGAPKLVTGGFAIALPGGGEIYGRSVGEQIVSLSCLLVHGRNNPTREAVAQLATYAKRHRLLVVDWLTLIVLRPEITTTVWEWPALHLDSRQPKSGKRPWWKIW